MSRTMRTKRPRWRWAYKLLKNGKVRDGVCQYITWACAHNNACDYCRGNRTHSSVRRAPIEERA